MRRGVCVRRESVHTACLLKQAALPREDERKAVARELLGVDPRLDALEERQEGHEPLAVRGARARGGVGTGGDGDGAVEDLDHEFLEVVGAVVAAVGRRRGGAGEVLRGAAAGEVLELAELLLGGAEGAFPLLGGEAEFVEGGGEAGVHLGPHLGVLHHGLLPARTRGAGVRWGRDEKSC